MEGYNGLHTKNSKVKVVYFPVFWYLCKDISIRTTGKQENNMKHLTRILILIVAGTLMLSACSKDKSDNSSLRFSVPAIYFSQSNTQATVSFESHDMVRYYLSQKPAGWDKYIVLNEKEKTLSISLPSELQKSADEKPATVAPSGEIILAGVSSEGIVKSATLFVGLLPTVDLSDKPANCFVVYEKNTHYLVPMTKPDGEPVAADHVDVVWQDQSELLNHIGMEDNCISFFLPENPTDKDQPIHGNAVIGAFDKKNNLLWSWHIWASRINPEKKAITYTNGYEMMDRNLGAVDNANSTAAERINSYGLYYQWGRRTPFTGPLDYIFTSGIYGFIYNVLGHRVFLKFEDTSAEKGVSTFADLNPLMFLKGEKQNGFDWMWNADDQAWNTDKNNNPCPHGWKVAPMAAFEGLTPDGTPDENACDLYGTKLTDGVNSSLWMGGGRMLYNSGRFQNIYIPAADTRNVAQEAQPWEGLYWTSEAGSNHQAKCFHFWYEKAKNNYGSSLSDEYQRANAMNIRCVRDK